MKVGLVLGGGGAVGMAYHAGALAVLEHDLGWDPRDAEVVVGTSAGAVVGSLLRRGIPASDLAALAVGATTTATPASVRAAVQGRAPFPELTLRRFLRPPRVPRPAVVARWLARPWRLDPVLALAGHLADGTVDLVALGADQSTAMGEDWPERRLWLCAVRRGDLRRVVFGRDAEAPLPAAVMASCCIPGYCRPVQVGDEVYLDGGIRSPTNADVLARADLDLDLAIVVSPMSGRDLPRWDPRSVVRRYAKARVDAEVDALATANVPTVVLEPGPDLVGVLGNDFMSEARTTDVVAGSFLDVGEQLRSPWTRTLVAGLDRRELERARRPAAAPPPKAA